MSEPIALLPAPATKEIEKPFIKYSIGGGYTRKFFLKPTANAWWGDSGKVLKLIQCFKEGYTIENACFYLDISYDQYRYFNEQHPEFYQIKQGCEKVAEMAMESHIFKRIMEGSDKMVMWAAERILFQKYGRRDPNLSQVPINNFGTIINQQVNVPDYIKNRLKDKSNG